MVLVDRLHFVKASTCIAVIGLLSSADDRTGWSQTFGAVAGAVGLFEACVTQGLRLKDVRMPLFSTSFSIASYIILTVAIVGLVCNSEDDQHPEYGPADVIERAACVLILAWGSMPMRFGSQFHEWEIGWASTKSAMSYSTQIEL